MLNVIAGFDSAGQYPGGVLLLPGLLLLSNYDVTLEGGH